MQTRSSTRVSKRPVPASRSLPERDNFRWTVEEEREMIRLRRQENLPFANIAHTLHRTPEAIKLRFNKLVEEHVEGGHSEAEALRWFNLSTE